MSRSEAEQLGDVLAHLTGRTDPPPAECLNCHSRRVMQVFPSEHWVCEDCGMASTALLVCEDQAKRAGPLWGAL